MSSGSGTTARVFRLPRATYFVVLFLFFGTAPLAFTAIDFGDKGTEGGSTEVGWQTALLLLPVLAAAFIARTATIVDAAGVRIRAVFGSRRLTWHELRGLSVSGRSVYAVTEHGSWRLPCVHVANLAALSRASDGRLPEIADPKPKFAPARRRRR